MIYLMLLHKKTLFIIVATIISLPLSIFLTVERGYAQPQTITTVATATTSTTPSNCITYNSKERLITITCHSVRLTDIANKLKDSTILKKESSSGSVAAVWLLSAGIVIDKGATFYINSTDTKWLKIIKDGKKDGDAYPIQVFGSLKVDSVKITSWNPKTNDYALTPDSERHGIKGTKTHIGTPRPYIRVEEGATGTTDITNSEIAYLGYVFVSF